MSDLAKRIEELSPEKRALLTLRLKQRQSEAARQEAIAPRADQDSWPLSFAQQRMWFLNQLEAGSPMYNIAAALRLSGPLHVAALEQALSAIVERHEVLRASFGTVKGHPVQQIAPAAALSLPVADLTGLPPEEREAEAMGRATAEAQRPFDLTSGPLLRAELLRLAETDHMLLLTLHHIAADGWSVGVLTQELTTLYGAYAAGGIATMPSLAIQYADYALWQRERLARADGEGIAPAIQFWREALAGVEPLNLPTDRARPAVQTFRGAHHSVELDGATVARLREIGKAEEATPFMTLLAAFNVLLSRYSGQEDFCVGTPIANRPRAELEGLIGFFVNTLVLRANLTDEPSFRQLLRRTRETALAAYQHQELPFEMLVEELKLERDLSRTPLFQTMFVLQGAPEEAANVAGVQMRALEIESGTSKFDLMLMLTESRSGVRATFEYNTDLFDAATIVRMAGHFATLLANIAANPDAPVSRLALLTAVEREQILYGWNDTAVAYPPVAALHHLFEVQVERTPTAVAMITWSDSNAETQRHRDAENTKDRIVDAAEG
nr:condensation domain-containing protein [Chloroflexaceae bacterium]